MRKILVLLLLVVPCFGQGSQYKDNIISDKTGKPIGGITVKLCTEAATGTPCTPAAPIYTDKALSVPIAGSVVTTDSLGQYSFYAAPGYYKLQISGPTITTQTNVIQVAITSPFSGNIIGNASTATALAANGTNCTAGQAPLGVDASGNAEGCWSPSVSAPVRQFSFLIGADNGSALLDTDDQADIFINGINASVTLAKVYCKCDGGTPTVNITTSAGVDILTSALACSAAGTNSTTFSGANNVIAADGSVNFKMVSAGGVVKRITLVVRYQ